MCLYLNRKKYVPNNEGRLILNNIHLTWTCAQFIWNHTCSFFHFIGSGNGRVSGRKPQHITKSSSKRNFVECVQSWNQNILPLVIWHWKPTEGVGWLHFSVRGSQFSATIVCTGGVQIMWIVPWVLTTNTSFSNHEQIHSFHMTRRPSPANSISGHCLHTHNHTKVSKAYTHTSHLFWYTGLTQNWYKYCISRFVKSIHDAIRLQWSRDEHYQDFQWLLITVLIRK